MWQEVESTNIQAAQWRAAPTNRGTLFLRFHKRDRVSGARRVYLYEDVPEHVFNELVAAESVGKYFDQYIKDHYIPVEVTGIPLTVF
jgi:hypothetical protein